jgi:hypothetical protein
MKLRRSLAVAAAAAATSAPVAVCAQVMGSVTTDPVGAPAPALTMPVLIALGIALIGAGAYLIRTRSAAAVSGLVLLAGLSLLAAAAYAIVEGVVIQGAECDAETTHTYPSAPGVTLTSMCPNQIRIVAINRCAVVTMAPVSPSDGSSLCVVGEILSYGQDCLLPQCAG